MTVHIPPVSKPVSKTVSTILHQEQEPAKKRAIVLGGGGSRGSYTIGALLTLIEQKKSYELVTGISIGAIVGAIYAMDKSVDLREVIASFSSSSVATSLFSFPKHKESLDLKAPFDFNAYVSAFQQDGPSVAPLQENFERLFDFEAFQNSKMDFACLAANLSKNTPAVFKKADMKTKEDVTNAVLASAAYFPAFSMREINGDYYVDGGFLNEVLGSEALKLGAEDLTVVALCEPDGTLAYEKEKTSLLIRPILKLAPFLDFTPDVLRMQIEQGRLEALKFMNLAPGYVYTFYSEDRLLFAALSKLAASILEKSKISIDNETIIGGLAELLGYRPGPLDNDYMSHFQAGLLLECLGLVAGVSCYQHWHFGAFLEQILHNLNTFAIHPSADLDDSQLRTDRAGALNLMAFFYGALKLNEGRLPDALDQIKKKFESVYYLGLAWYILDKFSALIKIL